jgi:hypothetical protein
MSARRGIDVIEGRVDFSMLRVDRIQDGEANVLADPLP